MQIYKSKLMRVINFIKNENKFERGDMVKVVNIKNSAGFNDKYFKYLNKYGIVVGIDYTKKEYIIEVKFEDRATICFKPNELEKIQPENPIRYKKLDIEY